MLEKTNHIKTDYIIKNIMHLKNTLKEERFSLEDTWKQVAHYVRPQKSSCGGDYKGKDIYDSTAILAMEYLVSGIWSLVSSSASSWFYLKLKDDKPQDENSKHWLQEINKIMKNNLSDASSGFYHKSYEFYADLVCFGTAVFYVEEDTKNKQVVYKSQNLSNCYLHRTSDEIDTIIRELKLNAQEMANLFGEDNLPQKYLQSLQTQDDTRYNVIHITAPTKYYKDDIATLKGMSHISYYIAEDTEEFLLKSGYYEFPYQIARWSTTSNQNYGLSPAISSLADIKMINAMSKTMLISAQKKVDPPILAPHEGAVQGIKTAPGGIIYGGLDPLSGQSLLKPLLLGGDLGNTYELQEQRRKAVKDAFYNSMLLFSYSHNATATEVLSVNEQNLRIMGSKIARIQTEFLYPMLKRQYAVMERLGLFPKTPPNIYKEDIEISFQGSWNAYQKTLDNIGINQISNAINNIKVFDENVVNMIDWQEVIKLIAESCGVPKTIFHKSSS